MSPIESQALGEVLFWFVVFILVVLALDWMVCRIHDGLTLTPEEQDQHDKDSA